MDELWKMPSVTLPAGGPASPSTTRVTNRPGANMPQIVLSHLSGVYNLWSYVLTTGVRLRSHTNKTASFEKEARGT